MRAFSLLAPVLLLSVLAACEESDPPLQPQETGQDVVDACIASGCTILNLDGRSLDDYGQLAALTQVEVLMLSYTDFSDLSVIAPLSGLRELHIGATDVTDLAGLAAFPDLTVLHVQDMDVQDFRPIRQLRGLEELAIGLTALPSVALVADLPALRRLDLTYATIADLSALRGHPSLEVVDLSGIYPLPDLTPLLAMPDLRMVTIDSPPDGTTAAVLADLAARGVTITEIEAVVAC